MRGASILSILLALAGASLLRAQTRLYFQESKNFRIVYYSPSHEYLAPVLIRSLENALRFYTRTFGYQPPAPITVLIRDFEDFGNGSAGSVPENVIQIGMSRFSLVFETMSAAERTMYDRARINLISEIAPALKVSAEEAERYLDEALAKGVLKPAKAAAKKKTS